jgi:pantoate--beta-alanine ligase
MGMIVKSITDLRTTRSTLTGSIGFVPTMGALHAGHEELIKRSTKECNRTIVSIFVNPTQFDSTSDLEKYPRTLERDLELLWKNNVTVAFIPDVTDLYPDSYTYRVSEEKISDILCGTTRPGHFSGMLTVVLKLLMLVNPTRAYFGEKDYQQLKLIEGMVEALFLPVHIIGCPTVREENGLALSSRNARLSPQGRELALFFARTLANFTLSVEEIREVLEKNSLRVDYIEERWGRRLGAVRVGSGVDEVRLIDNVKLP